MTKAMILSAIENIDSLLKKADLMDDDSSKMIRKLIYTKLDLCSPVVKMAGSGEDSKEKLLSFLVDVAAFGGDDMKQLCRFLAEMASFWEDCSSLVGMEDSGEENLYSFLLGIANSVTDTMKKQLVGIADSWKEKLGTVNEEISMNSLLIAMADLGQDNKGKLYNLLIGMVDFWYHHKEKLYRSVIWKGGDFSEIEKKLKLYILLDETVDSCKARLGMVNSKKDSKRKQLDLLRRLVNSLKGNNETVTEESVYSLQNDIEVGNKKKLYNSLSDFCQDHKEKVYRWLIGKGDFETGKKIKLYSLVNRMSDFRRDRAETLYNLFVRIEDPWKYNNITLYKSLLDMADFGKDERETVYSLVVEMANAWEHMNKEKLYSLLVSIWKENEEKEVNKEKLQGLLAEITDLWEDKEKLQGLLVELTQGIRIVDHNLVVEMAGLWEGNLMNKVKLFSWLAKKTHNLEHNLLFRLLLDVFYFCDESDKYTWKLEQVRDNLRSILDIITDKTLEEEEEEGRGLCYFISEVLEIAHDARHLLIQILASDPIVLLSQIFNNVKDYHRYHRVLTYDFNQSLRNMSGDVVGRLEEIKNHIHQEIGVGRAIRAKNVREISLLKGGENVVGLEEDIKMLLQDIHTVTCIKGMGGIGKTTLARELYNHRAVVDQFECRVWVCFSEQLSHKELFIMLLRQVVDGKEFERDMSLEKMDNKSLIAMLHQHLQCVRYFIVLDDVAHGQYMNRVFESLPRVKGSRLVFTTRIPGVKFISHGDYTEHKMKFLDEHKSWELLLKTLTLFLGTSDKKFPKELEKRGRRVLEKCNGLPLAIKEVGMRWAEMIRSGSKWEELLEEPIDLSATLEVLDRSYQNWHGFKRLHFLHLSLFKEGTTSTTIRVKRLEHILHVALAGMDVGFSLSNLLDLSEESVIELKNPTKTNNIFKRCRIIPVFQMLSITKAHDEISLEILNKDGNNRCSHEPRHRVIYCSREKFDYSTNQDKHLVSLFFHGGGYFDTSPSYWKNFEQLKILDMEDFGLKILPDAVGTLFELEYLGLRNNYLQEIPPSLGRLKRLEVLDIAQNLMVEVPNIIWEMDSLRHLYMSSIICEQPLKLDGLMKLSTLSYISVYSWTYELSSLESMGLLSQLGIEEVDRNTDVSRLFASLAKLQYLRFLTLRGFCFKRMPSLDELGILQKLTTLKLDGLLTKLPSVSNFPPNIECLSLVNSCLDEDPMPTLEKLPELCILKLQNAYTGQQMVITPHGFRYLEYLYIGELWHLRTVQVGEGGMSNLQELEINSCPYLETLPGEIWSKELKMVTTKNIATKLRRSRFTSGMGKVDIQP